MKKKRATPLLCESRANQQKWRESRLTLCAPQFLHISQSPPSFLSEKTTPHLLPTGFPTVSSSLPETDVTSLTTMWPLSAGNSRDWRWSAHQLRLRVAAPFCLLSFIGTRTVFHTYTILMYCGLITQVDMDRPSSRVLSWRPSTSPGHPSMPSFLPPLVARVVSP